MYKEGSKGMGLLPAYGFDLMRTKATTQSSLQRTSERASERAGDVLGVERSSSSRKIDSGALPKSYSIKTAAGDACLLQVGGLCAHIQQPGLLDVVVVVFFLFLWYGRQRNSLGRTSLHVIMQSPVQLREQTKLL